MRSIRHLLAARRGQPGMHRQLRQSSCIGFVGLGHMGSKMVTLMTALRICPDDVCIQVRNLRGEGHTLLVYDNSTDAVKAVVDDGITAAVCHDIAAPFRH